MGKRADETRDAQLIGEKITNDERPEEERSDPPSARAVDAEARDPKPVEGVTPEADDDEYEMVDLCELVDVPEERDASISDAPAFQAAEMPKELVAAQPPAREPSRPSPLLRHSLELPPPVRVTKSLLTNSASIPPPPDVPSRTLPPPPLRTSSTSLPPPPRDPISSPPDFTISGTVPPLAKPSKNRFERALSGRQAAAAAVLAAICAAGYFGAKRGEGMKSDPPREVAAANLPSNPPAPQETVAVEPAANTAADPVPQAPETKPSPSPVVAEPKKSAAAPASTAANPAACTLNLNTIPASRVALDGRDLGMTPKIGVSVEPGTHVVMFANAGGKKVTSAQCKAGEQKTVVVRLPI